MSKRVHTTVVAAVSPDHPIDFEAFLDAQLGWLARYAGVLTGDRQVAHDVLTEALVSALRAWERIGRMDKPGGYVRAIVTTTYLDHCRKASARKTALTNRVEVLDSPMGDRMSQIDDRLELESLLRRLPERQRVVLVLRYYLDLPDEEIANNIGCSVSTVRSSAFRGLANLRKHATPSGGG